ncbi:MAG: chemotaxis protein CheA [Armatimonadota bacterium]
MSGQFDASDFFDLFIQEATELIETMDQSVIGLENDPSSTERIEAIFRAAHSLKASAASQGFEEMSKISHALENLFTSIRDGDLEVTAPLIDRLLEGIDALKLHLQCAVNDDPPPDIGVDDIPLRTPEKVDDERAATCAQEDVAAGERTSMDVPDDALMIDIVLDGNCDMPAARAWLVLQQIEGYADVISSDPSLDDLEEEETDFDTLSVILETSLSGDDLLDLTSALPDVAEVSITDHSPQAEEPVKAEQVADSRVEEKGGSGGPPVVGMKRSPSTVRVAVENIDALMNLVGELVINRTRLTNLSQQLRSRAGSGLTEMSQNLEQITSNMGMLVTELQERVMKTRMVPVQQLFGRFPRLVRDAARREEKQVALDIRGGETELDRSVIEDIVDPLTHLLRNAVSHGIESPQQREKAGKSPEGTVRLSARQEEGSVIIEVCDDGRGIDPDAIRRSAVERGVVDESQAASMSDVQALELIFTPGFSTAQTVSDVSGRGVGMDVVKNNIDKLGGLVEIDSTPGTGTTVSLHLPLTLAIIQGLLVQAADIVFALPLASVYRILRVEPHQISRVGGTLYTIEQDRALPLISLAQIANLRKSEPETADTVIAVLVGDGRTEVGLLVDELIGNEELVIQPLGDVLKNVKMVSGAALLGDGRLTLIVDTATMLRQIGSQKHVEKEAPGAA